MLKRFFNLRPWIRIIIMLIYLGIVTALSLLPTSNLPNIPFINGQDKAVHITMYLGLAFLASWSLDTHGKRKPSIPLMLAGVAGWGVLMEVLQHLMTSGRGLEYTDMIANLAGATAGMFLYIYLEKIRKAAEG
jgi:VanZ family protein